VRPTGRTFFGGSLEAHKAPTISNKRPAFLSAGLLLVGIGGLADHDLIETLLRKQKCFLYYKPEENEWSRKEAKR